MMLDSKSGLHCTAKFCGFQFRKKSNDENPEMKKYVNKVQENIGKVQRLKIIGYFFTKETVGCRVELDENQLDSYDQKELFDSTDLKRQYGETPKKTSDDKNNVSLQF